MTSRPSAEGADPDRRVPVVAFDFDGTITEPDTFGIFLRHVRGRPAVVAAFVRHLPSVVVAARGGPFRDRAKERVVGEVVRGLPMASLEAAAGRTTEVILRSGLREDTVQHVRAHVAAGHRVVVVSASFEVYVRPVVAALGVDEVIATGLEVDEQGFLTGRFSGPNVRGRAKARLLTDHLDGATSIAVAYGNTKGDRELLAMADRPVWVRRRVSVPPLADVASGGRTAAFD